MKRRAPRWWHRRGPVAVLLWPLAMLFAVLAALRRTAYRRGWARSSHPGVPVVIVGNINAGGSGKSPLVIALVKLFKRQGLRVGVVARGYGGRAPDAVTAVAPDSDPRLVGDEAVMLARRCETPVVVGARRVLAAQRLLADQPVDLILCDDGLQHYALRRDLEIAVVDPDWSIGNGWPLPAGPLREPRWRLETVDHVVYRGDPEGYLLQLGHAQALAGVERRELALFRGERVHAVAGIADPDRFFEALREGGVVVVEHPFPDHHDFCKADFRFAEPLPVLMTEKDAVKCAGLGLRDAWVISADALLARGWSEQLCRQVVELVAHYNRESAVE